ncbi:MAG: hypothetical protein EXS05_15945 [Planctomycetaceae bacterium]|nr:hypothetical protein [Planctomycetaceae bacterium]
MDFSDFEQQHRFRQAWEAVEIARPVEYSLFTFGESELPYFLVVAPRSPDSQVSITRGEIRVTRPLIITPDNLDPELGNFFEDEGDGEDAAWFIMKRTAAFSHLKFQNQKGPARIVTDSVEEAVARLNRQLDAEDDDRVAILCAPAPLAGFAIFRYAAERVMKSAPDNIREMRERGFLP